MVYNKINLYCMIFCNLIIYINQFSGPSTTSTPAINTSTTVTPSTKQSNLNISTSSNVGLAIGITFMMICLLAIGGMSFYIYRRRPEKFKLFLNFLSSQKKSIIMKSQSKSILVSHEMNEEGSPDSMDRKTKSISSNEDYNQSTNHPRKTHLLVISVELKLISYNSIFSKVEFTTVLDNGNTTTLLVRPLYNLGSSSK